MILLEEELYESKTVQLELLDTIKYLEAELAQATPGRDLDLGMIMVRWVAGGARGRISSALHAECCVFCSLWR